jgi:c-di-GMP-related signal transduction protein
VAIAKIIHVKTLVERVETYEQYIILRALWIDYFQWYFFHKPAPLPDYVKKPETFLEKTHKWFIFSRYTDIRRQAGELINNFVTQLVLLIRK